jgi:hypothetical protein
MDYNLTRFTINVQLPDGSIKPSGNYLIKNGDAETARLFVYYSCGGKLDKLVAKYNTPELDVSTHITMTVLENVIDRVNEVFQKLNQE